MTVALNVNGRVEAPPRVGMFAIVRNRRGVISAVEPEDGAKGGRLHLVHIEYKDDQEANAKGGKRSRGRARIGTFA